jgi:hypothetical protein
MDKPSLNGLCFVTCQPVLFTTLFGLYISEIANAVHFKYFFEKLNKYI